MRKKTIYFRKEWNVKMREQYKHQKPLPLYNLVLLLLGLELEPVLGLGLELVLELVLELGLVLELVLELELELELELGLVPELVPEHYSSLCLVCSLREGFISRALVW